MFIGIDRGLPVQRCRISSIYPKLPVQLGGRPQTNGRGQGRGNKCIRLLGLGLLKLFSGLDHLSGKQRVWTPSNARVARFLGLGSPTKRTKTLGTLVPADLVSLSSCFCPLLVVQIVYDDWEYVPFLPGDEKATG